LLADLWRERTMPPELRAIADKAAAESPERRYLTVSALRAEIARFRARRPVDAYASGWRYALKKFIERHRLAVAVSLLGTLIALTAGALALKRIDAESTRAEREAAQNAQVSAFLQSVLIEASPTLAGGARPTVDHVLDRAAERLRSELSDDPALRATLLTLIARVYIEHEDHARALPLIREAVALDAAPNAEERARRLMMLGTSEHQLGQSESALQHFAQAQMLAVDAPLKLKNQIDRNRAQVLYQIGRVDEAIAQQQGASRTVETADGETPMLVANLINQGQMEAGASIEAGAITLERAYRLSLKVNGPDHPHTLLAGSTNVTMLTELKRGDEAIALGQQIVAANRRVFGEASPHFANALMALGYAYQGAQDDENALATYQQSLNAWDALPPGNDLNSVTVLQQMGDIDYARGDYAQAVERYREMLKRNSNGLRAADPDVGQRPLRLARSLAKQGQCTAAKEYLALAQTLAQKAPKQHSVHRQLEEGVGC
jgi:eukaryotic-like serine/threonine-protein kinase